MKKEERVEKRRGESIPVDWIKTRADKLMELSEFCEELNFQKSAMIFRANADALNYCISEWKKVN